MCPEKLSSLRPGAIVADRFASGVSDIRTSFYRIVRFRLLARVDRRSTHTHARARAIEASSRKSVSRETRRNSNLTSSGCKSRGRFHSLHKTHRHRRSRPRSAFSPEIDFVRVMSRAHTRTHACTRAHTHTRSVTAMSRLRYALSANSLIFFSERPGMKRNRLFTGALNIAHAVQNRRWCNVIPIGIFSLLSQGM